MRELRVSLDFGPDDRREVGVLAEDGRRIWFEFADAGAEPLDVSPYALPRAAGPLIEHRPKPGVPIPGVFADARPDGWGLKLLHRVFQRAGRAAASVSPLDELAFLGDRTMGALTFEPSTGPMGELADAIALAEFAEHARRVYDDEVTDVLPELVRAGASSGGARPKALIGLRSDGSPGVLFGEGELPEGWDAWLVKFPTSQDDPDVGRRELAWMRMAAAAGIDAPECRLLPLGDGIGDAFAVRRFDRPGGGRRLHMLSAAGALDVDFRTAVTDYAQLLRLTHFLSGGDQRQVLAMFRLAVFNVAAVNQDDHLKNVSFLLGLDGAWRLAPGYDLTFAPHPTGERATLVGGEGRDVRRAHFEAICQEVGIRGREQARILGDVLGAVERVDEHLGAADCRGPVSEAASQAVREAARTLR